MATSAGIQVFDPRGRIVIVLPRPKHEDARTNYVTFGGLDRKTLYVATAKTIYKRPQRDSKAWIPPRLRGRKVGSFKAGPAAVRIRDRTPLLSTKLNTISERELQRAIKHSAQKAGNCFDSYSGPIPPS